MRIVGVSIADLARMMMKLFIMTVLTATAAQLDCQDCTTVTNTLKDIVTTKEDIDIQIEVKEKNNLDMLSCFLILFLLWL